MIGLRFEWNSSKASRNLLKHGVSFEEAESIFYDPFARLIIDTEHSEDEERYLLLGNSRHSRLLVVCHCIRNGEIIRLISARKATRREQSQYEHYRHA